MMFVLFYATVVLLVGLFVLVVDLITPWKNEREPLIEKLGMAGAILILFLGMNWFVFGIESLGMAITWGVLAPISALVLTFLLKRLIHRTTAKRFPEDAKRERLIMGIGAFFLVVPSLLWNMAFVIRVFYQVLQK